MLKKAYSSAFGALGDSFFWHSLRPLSFAVAAIVGVTSPFLGLLVYLVLFNIFHLSFLFAGYGLGLRMGRDVIIWFNRIGLNKWPEHFDLASVFFFGLFLSLLFKHKVTVNVDNVFIAAAYLLMGLVMAKNLFSVGSLNGRAQKSS
jgi:mannose/fructose/N-acetylgalactosamine-specific phosphotransferase system component IID